LECEVLTYVSLYVTNRASILRILIAVLLCGGLCRLDWRHIHSHIAPEQASHQQMLREAIYEYGVVFSELFSDAVSHPGQQTQGVGATFVFEFDKPLTVPAPLLAIESRIGLELLKAQSAEGDCVKNKDPPSHDGQVPRFSSLA
jgi:hypothetical protein